ncbi:MAG TPA: ROK family protein [Beutenbergiaceae bacterium]|nr:ROK family protein [Beutenbergiaceae bacterium]
MITPAPASRVLGIDLGGTTTGAALVEASGDTGPVASTPTPAAAGPEAILDAVATVVTEVLNHGGPAPAAVGIGTAGVVDVDRGTIISATDALTGWVGTDVADGLRRRLHPLLGPVPVIVQNDVDAHAAGEAWVGAAAGMDNVLMVAVGTGVGGAVVLDGHPLRGAHHLAGEMGHIPTPGAEGLRCSCGRRGHLEALSAGPALHRYYLALGGEAASGDARDVAARATSGEPLATLAVHHSATALGRAIAGICTVLDPAAVVIGGGLAGAGPVWWQAVEQALRAEVVEPLAEMPLLPATLGDRAAIIGAARSAWRLVDAR